MFCFSTDQGGLLALADGPCADTSSILADLVSVLFKFVLFLCSCFSDARDCFLLSLHR